MVTRTKSRIKSRVRLILDEQAINEAQFAPEDLVEADDVALDSIIEEKAEEAIRYVYSVADASLLPWLTSPLPSDTEVTWNTNGLVSGYKVGIVSIRTSSVWRWNAARLGSWPRFVARDEAVDISSPEFAKLLDKYCTGTWERPVIGVEYGNDDDTLYMFSAKNTEETDTFTIQYLPKPAFDNDSLTIGERVEDAFIYYLSGLVCQVLGDDRQEGLFQQAAELMGKTQENN